MFSFTFTHLGIMVKYLTDIKEKNSLVLKYSLIDLYTGSVYRHSGLENHIKIIPCNKCILKTVLCKFQLYKSAFIDNECSIIDRVAEQKRTILVFNILKNLRK